MKIILVNAPKGGVGKTTLSTNIALYLKRQGYKVLAFDTAQGELMTRQLKKSGYFSNPDINILTEELEVSYTNPLKKRLINNQVDFIVVDTDDYFKVLTEFPSSVPTNIELLILVPIVDEPNTRERITQEINTILIHSTTSKNAITLRLVCNKCTSKLKNRPKKILESLSKVHLDQLLTEQMIHLAHHKYSPYYIDCPIFNSEIESLLKELKVIP